MIEFCYLNNLAELIAFSANLFIASGRRCMDAIFSNICIGNKPILAIYGFCFLCDFLGLGKEFKTIDIIICIVTDDDLFSVSAGFCMDLFVLCSDPELLGINDLNIPVLVSLGFW